MAASDIVKSVEEAFGKSTDLREQAARLIAEAEAVEKRARSRAIDALGPEMGLAAVKLAALSAPLINLDGVSEVKDQANGPLPDTDTARNHDELKKVEVEEEPPLVTISAATSTPDEAVTSRDAQAMRSTPRPDADASTKASVSELFGVDIPPSRMEEAHEVVEAAKAAAAQGRKANPHGNDRGKNAWRKKLYKAAWDAAMAELSSVERAPLSLPVQPARTDAPHPELRQSFREPVAAELDDLDEEAGLVREQDTNMHAKHDHHDDSEDVTVDDVLDIDDITEDVLKESYEDPDDLDVDPFDDLDEDDELPPESTLPPPRVFSRPATETPPQTTELDERPAEVTSQHGETETLANGAEKKPVAVEDYPLHTSMPIPPGRRAGSGQTIQTPATVPKKPQGPSRGFVPPPPPVFSRKS